MTKNLRALMRCLPLMLAAPLMLANSDPSSRMQHTVKEGETLGGIANRTGVSIGVIAAANGLQAPYQVRVGQVLNIPRQRKHTVKSGDTFFGIANRYDVPPLNLAIANGIEKPYPIRIGQVLIIPAYFDNVPTPQAGPSEPYFRRPHDGATLYRYTRRADGGGHEGLDIALATGDMVRASAGGTVVFAGAEPKRFGRQVIIDHGDGWRTSYGHLSRVTVTKGEYVKAGERIGLGGSAGVATRPELHFEIRKDGKPIDPTSKLPSRRTE